MNLENLKKEILRIRTDCYQKQKVADDMKPICVKYKFNKDVTFYAVDSGYSIVLSHTKKGRSFQLLADQWTSWILNNLNPKSDSMLSSPEHYGIKEDSTKSYLRMFILHEARS